MLHISVAQLNPTVGDVPGNVARMISAAERAARAHSQLVVFPELSVSGYYPGDLLNEPGFVAAVERGVEALREASRQLPALHWVVGAPSATAGPGKRLANALLVLHAGEIVLRYDKQLLPTYEIFDERRHFEPGPDAARVLNVAGTRVGFLICEDGWNDHGLDYALNPLERMRHAAPDLVVSINASPSHIGKREQRHQVFRDASRRHGFPVLYVNQIGGQDQLVFDGASFGVEPDAGVVFEAARFTEDFVAVGFGDGRFQASAGGSFAFTERGLPTSAFYHAQIVLGLRDYARRCGFRQAVIGSSGGIDSAVSLALAVDALGAENVTAITMPSRVSSRGSVQDSLELARNLGISLATLPIADIVDQHAQAFAQSFGEPLTGLPLENLQARIRGTALMAYSNRFGHLLLTTGNKSEISVGYCTLYGDTNGGLGLIGDLYKTEVFALAEHINCERARIPHCIVAKEPSAELAEGQRDSDSLPPYPVLDDVLRMLIEGPRMLAEDERIAATARWQELRKSDEGRALIRCVTNMIARNEYKRRQAPPIIRVRGRAFGSGRQIPIAVSDAWEAWSEHD